MSTRSGVRMRPWRVWSAHLRRGESWHSVTGMAYTSEEAAVAAARRQWPNGTGPSGNTYGVGRVDGAIKKLEEYP